MKYERQSLGLLDYRFHTLLKSRHLFCETKIRLLVENCCGDLAGPCITRLDTMMSDDKATCIPKPPELFFFKGKWAPACSGSLQAAAIRVSMHAGTSSPAPTCHWPCFGLLLDKEYEAAVFSQATR